MQHSDRYDKWNAALLERFFRPKVTGEPVYLAVDDDELDDLGEAMGLTDGAAADDLVLALRERMAGGAGLIEFVHQVPGWRRHTEAPPYIACLALMVLAASRMASDEQTGVHGNDYYARLNPLLYRQAAEGQPDGFEELQKVWRDLDTWLDDDLRGLRGQSTIRTHPHFVHIGWPMSQCVLRASDRVRLHDFFRWAGFEPGEVVAGQRLLALFRSWARPGCGLSRAGLRAVAMTTVAMEEQLAGLLATELASWDGELRDAKGRRRGEIVFFGQRKGGGRNLELAMFARRPDGFPEGNFTADGGTVVPLGASSSDGWYARLPVKVTSARFDRPLRLTQGDYSLVSSPEPIIPMRETFSPDSGWMEVRQVTMFEPHVVLVHQSRAERVREFATRYAEEGWKPRSPAGIPDGWVMLDRFRINSAPPNVAPDLVRLAPRLHSSLSLVNGLRLAPNMYLVGGEPDMQVTFEDAASAVVELDEERQQFHTAAVELRLAGQGLEEGDHTVAAGGQSRRFTTVTGFDVVRADSAGSMALSLEHHSGYRPVATEAQEVLRHPTRGTVRIAGAHIQADPEDLPLVPSLPVVLRRGFLRWQLLGPRAGDIKDGGPSPKGPRWLDEIPGEPTCQFFEDFPPFAPELVIYIGHEGPLVRLLVKEPGIPWIPNDGEPGDAVSWANLILRTERRGADVDERAESVWPHYVELAKDCAGGR